MNWKHCSASVVVSLCMTSLSHAATINFRMTQKSGTWSCAQNGPTDSTAGLVIQLLIDGAPADRTQVQLNATYDDGGASKSAPVPYAGPNNLWALKLPDAKPGDTSAVGVKGKVAAADVTCSGKLGPAAADNKGQNAADDSLPTRAKYTALDLAASEWLATDAAKGALQTLIQRIQAEHQGTGAGDIVLLKHLPSGAIAFPFPNSISERQLVQIVSVVNKRDLGTVDIAFTKCERPNQFRINGDFGSLAAKPQSGEEPPPDFALLPIGPVLQCGADAMGYTVTVTANGATAKTDPAAVHLQVRPVYHLGATGFFGFDTVKKPTFAVQNGAVTKQTDAIGAGLLVGATWYPFGVDYGHMRIYNYLVNPFGAVDLNAPKDNFVLGDALTVTGGISLAIGWAFHHLDTLNGVEVGGTLTGNGAIPTRKTWSKEGRGLYVGVAVDQNILTALKKITPSTGGSK